MTEPRTELKFVKPRIPLLIPDISIYVMLPGYGRRGPVSLREEFATLELVPGKYQLFLGIPGSVDIKLNFELRDSATTTIGLADGLSLAQRLKLRTTSEPPVVYLKLQHTHESHFWIGHSDSAERLGQFLSEDAYWALDDEARDASSLSEFAATQHETWYDHDFLEAGYEVTGPTLEERFRNYSWSDSWAGELAQRARQLGVVDPNCMITLGGSPNEPSNWRLDAPADISLPGIELRYAGTITF